MLQTISQISTNDRTYKAVVETVTSHVLLVETDRQLAQIIAQKLSSEGYQVGLAEDGISGFLAVPQTSPHLIILSWTLLRRVLPSAALNL